MQATTTSKEKVSPKKSNNGHQREGDTSSVEGTMREKRATKHGGSVEKKPRRDSCSFSQKRGRRHWRERRQKKSKREGVTKTRKKRRGANEEERTYLSANKRASVRERWSGVGAGAGAGGGEVLGSGFGRVVREVRGL